ncbi:MAG TPA: DEAD/DEAH box helicase, partial [Ramlibacter sp.]
AGAVLLGQLSNTRAVNLAMQRELLVSDLGNRLGVALRLESQRRALDQSVLVESSGQWLDVNGFQQRFWNSAQNSQWLSASAPTASGKTFLVSQWLIDQMQGGGPRTAIYLAPTRALVSEIESNLLKLLGKDSQIDVSSLPLRDKFQGAVAGGKRLIMVFTQERLHLFANLMKDEMATDLLVVDEAHKVGDNQRGVILQDAVERACRANLAMRVVFISPATQNPEELLADAPPGASKQAVDSDAPTVLQNLITADQVPRRPKEWALNLLHSGSNLPIGVLKLANSPSTLRKRMAFIAAAAGARGGTLVYANRADDAEKVAHLISQLMPEAGELDPEIAALADLARKGVHPSYMLAPIVKRGVAFHYGNMPSLLRLEIERLFRSGKIRFLVCTSTLIEGVNLSCRTIVVRGPRKGQGHVMEPHDFWNLAGRAGRWGDEFQGNIICVDPSDRSAWPSGVPSRARYPIKRESDAVLDLGDALAEYLDRRPTTSPDQLTDGGKFEQVGAYLLSTFMRAGTITQSSLATRHDPNQIRRLEQSLAALAERIEISAETCARHPGVSPVGLQRLLEAFRAYAGDVENLLPAPVDSKDSYDRFITIMRRINQHVYPAFDPDQLVPLYGVVIVEWLKGYTLATMIKRNIEWHRNNRRAYKLPVLIRNTMELVERIARFAAPKYVSAYVDVLTIHLTEIGRADLIEADLDIGTQLEFGVSSVTLLSLIELGLSRMSAAALYEIIARDDLTKEACIAWAIERNDQFEGMGIPSIIIGEIRGKLLPDQTE